MLEVSFEYRDRATLGWWEQAYLYCGADVMILKMAGYDFTSGAIADITAPEIEVDAPKMLPNAVVGKPYAIFDAKAFDKIDGNIALRVRVVYNYGTAQYVDVKIVDGKFVPTYTGEYSIVYTATDRAGNVAEVVKKITVLAHNPEDLSIVAADDGKNEYIQGETVALRKAEAQGGAGGTYEITATVFDENRQTIDVAENAFQALTPGVYTVEYRVKDYVGNSASFAYAITVKEQALPQLQSEKLVIQPIFTAGQSYKLPNLTATDYAGDKPNDVAAEIYVRYPGGEFEKVADADAFVADENRVKLFPRDAMLVAEKIGQLMSEATGHHIEAMVYGDGAFKDPAGKIWELADPVVSPGYTAGLEGTPNELKLKYLADHDFGDLSGEALQQAVAQKIREKDASVSLVGNMVSEGTTPRHLTDLIGSLCDLTSGSGDKGTPVIYIQGYFDNYTNE